MTTKNQHLETARAPECCDTRTPGHPCSICGAWNTDAPISRSRALASNA